MLVIGLTGGLGSGKSTVAKLFSDRHHIPIIDADQIAREITAPHKPAFHSIIKHFGHSLISENGSLDRSQLRNIIFEIPKERLWLENLLHPFINKEMERQIAALQTKTPYCIAVIPLLIEAEFYALINRILVVDTSETLQISRVQARDKMKKQQIEAILKAQTSRSERLERAHDIICNNGILADLVVQVDKLHEKYCSMSSQT